MNPEAPAALSRQLRYGQGRLITHRRVGVAMSLVSAACMGLIALYQMGLIRQVPEPRWPGLDADRIHGSDQAYAILRTPDGVLGFGSFALSLMLAAAGGLDRTTRSPWLPLAWSAKAIGDALMALKLTLDEAFRYRTFSLWALLATGATLATVPMALIEAAAAMEKPIRSARQRVFARI